MHRRVAGPLPHRESSTGRRRRTMRGMQTTTTTTTTTTTIESTIDRYVAMWNEADGASRTEQARAIWAGDGRLVDPLTDAVGPDAIATAIGALRDQMPG